VGAAAGRRPSRIEALAADRPGALRLAVAGLALPVGLAALWLLLTSSQVDHPAITAPVTQMFEGEPTGQLLGVEIAVPHAGRP